jgi:NIMA (never in mitosis gene a)-related kinase
MWMLGCILYELCTFRRPFEGDSLNQVLSKITKVNHQKISEEYDPVFHRLIDLLLQKSASLRASINEILEIPEI